MDKLDKLDDNIAKIMQFRQKSEVFELAYNLTKDIVILAKMYDNYVLTRSILRSNCAKFTKLLDALNSVQDDRILIQFTDIDLFCIFENREYMHFVDTINMNTEADTPPINLYQIILAGKRQKMVFACTDSKYFTKLQTYARDCFNAKVTASRNQITVDIINSSENDINTNYDRLYKYIDSIGDIDCLEVMNEIRIISESTHKYRKFSLNDNFGGNYTPGELISMLRSVHTLNITITGNNNNVMSIVNVDKKQQAREWISANPPIEREVTANYYARYTASGLSCIAVNQFGKSVRELGYKTIQSTNNRVWVKA